MAVTHKHHPHAMHHIRPSIHQDGRHKNNKRIWAGMAIILLLLVGYAHLKYAFLAQLALVDTNPPSFSYSQTDPVALTDRARQEHLINGDLVKARYFYDRALDYCVLYVPAWLGLAELFNDRGEKNRAVAALEFVEKISRGNGNLAWSRAILANELGRDDILTANLVWLMKNQPGKRMAAISLADLRWQDPLVLLRKFGDTFSPELLNYYIRVKELPKTRIVWQQLEQAGLNNRKNSLRYINYLLAHGKITAAAKIWSRNFRDGDALLYNGHFQKPLIGSGFGWRISRPRGVAWQNPADKSGLRLTFDGSKNVSFRLAQIVPLPPGDYVFKGRAETDSLSTNQRPFWMVRGFKCKGPVVRAAMFPANRSRSDFSLRFTVPESCQAVWIALQRNHSYDFDNKISGTLVLDDLTVTGVAVKRVTMVHP
ncbi:hypothetical protein BMS3Bbin14_00125 [bacterium BMS3Bbin14]|nr:hypothetical protein BMS3Bbin14_00125 [bacterium BMS3Bbin14]